MEGAEDAAEFGLVKSPIKAPILARNESIPPNIFLSTLSFNA